jgi:SH3-like domain-containing protein
MKIIRPLIFIALMLVSFFVLMFSNIEIDARAQQPTVAIATVTGTPIGSYIIVNADQEQINVRGGPGTDYSAVGVLVAGELIPAKGRSAAGLWIQIVYSGVDGGLAWVYSPLVTIFQGSGLAIVAPPPTPTLRVTSTIDPTLAAQFVLEVPATRLPTFTAPAPLVIPTFEQSSPVQPGGIPVGMYITTIALLGLFGATVSFLRDR